MKVDKTGRQTFTELVPPPARNDGFSSESDRSRFSVEITEGCLVAGMSASAGDVVRCSCQNAMLLLCRGRIVNEERNFW
jgi:hypothetical protein